MSDTDLAFRTTIDGSGFASGLQNMTSHLEQFGIRTNTASTQLGGLGTLLGTFANPLTAVALGITAIGGALVGSAQAAATWESSMVGVAKTTGLAGPALEGLSQSLLTLSTEMPVAADQLASVAAAAGSLGIGQQQADMGDYSGQAAAIEEFTEVAIKMGVGFEMAADQAATAGAKILNSFGQNMDASNLEKLGSVVNTMGDAFAATEPQVLDFLNRASFLNSTMGQTIPQVAALGTTLISTGLDSVVAATGLKSFLNMATSQTSKTGGMDNWAKLMGTSVDELKAKMGSDLNSTLIETANKIVAIQDPVERFQQAVALAGTEGAPALLKLAGQQENYNKALGMTNAQWENAQSLQKTYDAQMESVNSKWTIFTNTISMASTEFGTGLLPTLGSVLGFLTDITKIGVKAAETVSDVLSPITDAAGGLLAESYEGSGVQMAWEAAKNWAGIGTEQAEQMAKEIEENKPLQLAGAEAIKVGVDMGLYDETGKLIAAKVFDENAWQLEANDAIINSMKNAYENGVKIIQEDQKTGRLYDQSGAEWKNDIGAVLGATTANGVDLVYTIGGNGNSSYVAIQSPDGNLFTKEYFGISSREQAIKDLVHEHASELGLDPIGELELQGQYLEADKLRLTNSLEIENMWDVADSQRSWLKFSDENKDLAAKAGDEIVLALYNATNSALLENNDTLSESFANVMKAITDPGSVPIQIFNQSLADCIDSGLILPSWSDELTVIASDAGSMAGKGFAEGLGIGLKDAMESFDWSKLLKGDLTGIGDQYLFGKTVFQPELLETARASLDLWDTQLQENMETVRDNIAVYQALAEVLPQLFTADQLMALQKYDSAIGNERDTLEAMLKDTDAITEAVDRQSVGYNQLEKAIGDCAECAISEFGAWQEAQTQLFQGSYIGEGGADYIAWKTQELDRLAETQAGMAAVGGMSIDLKLDTTAAEAMKADFITKLATANPTTKLVLDSAAALQAFHELQTEIEATPFTVQVYPSVHVDELRAAIAQAFQEAVA